MAEAMKIIRSTGLNLSRGQTEKSRGRPRSALKNQSILDAASDLFMENGFDGTSMDEVAKRAGVSKQTVYSHFSNKEKLFSASITSVINQYFPDSVFEVSDGHEVESDLNHLCEIFLHLFVSEDAICMFRLLAAAASLDGENKLATLFWEAGPEVMLQKLAGFMSHWGSKGQLSIKDPVVAAKTLISLIKGHYHFQLAIGLISDVTEDEIKEHAKLCTELFLKIYKA
ncbi:TetR/AcrR family transcriptional regulator [Temperatibacter marinus]|uniref:TetR/AcrR family transcriptional regulator n=1 Tax=Temperatibacter marinus TaxID=1456591 RepID=A0AA52EEF0_9PROT|nr:TetR/AcrR family transcriptional regulator [Temperatibacter marinus]WND01563.1 TetR/AcrR family transcriptional regulator [Temperatibacter marinus]